MFTGKKEDKVIYDIKVRVVLRIRGGRSGSGSVQFGLIGET